MLTSPGLSWQASLKMCKTPLELFTDINMHLFIEKGIRGCMSMISRWYDEANNQLLPNYNPIDTTSYIIYLDAKNLYGWAMKQPFPHGGFEWVPSEIFNQQNILQLSDASDTGFIFEVDLEYPAYLHVLHSDYTRAPEKCIISPDMLSRY